MERATDLAKEATVLVALKAADVRREPIPQDHSKRTFDLTLLVLSAPLWAPIALFCAAWVKAVSRGPLFFQQERIGQDGKRFKIFKFRSMHQGADTSVQEKHVERVFDDGPMTKLDAADSRLIPGGRLLRASGLDELPQLINVIRGEMSLVGPRPCTPNEVTIIINRSLHLFQSKIPQS